MTEPILLARMGSGAEWEDPSEDHLYELLADIERGEERSLTVQHLEEEGHPQVRLVRTADGDWIAEVASAIGAGVDRKSWDDIREAHRWLASWAFRIEEAADPPVRAFGFGSVIFDQQSMRFVIEDIHDLVASPPSEGYSNESAGLGLVFEIPAQTFEGVRFRRFDRKSRSIEIGVAVPANLAASDTSIYLRTVLEQAFQLAEAYLARKKLDLGLHEVRAAIGRAIASLPAAPISEIERYREIKPPSAQGRPVRVLLELDGAGRDLRRIEEYADGRMDYAVKAIETGTTQLDRAPLVSRDASDRGNVLPERAFLAAWDRAINQPAPRGTIRVVEYPKRGTELPVGGT
jgi:hypothetical protein